MGFLDYKCKFSYRLPSSWFGFVILNFVLCASRVEDLRAHSFAPVQGAHVH